MSYVVHINRKHNLYPYLATSSCDKSATKSSGMFTQDLRLKYEDLLQSPYKSLLNNRSLIFYFSTKRS